MNKKFISATIFTLSLLQGIGSAYAGDIHGQIGGDGAGDVFNLQEIDELGPDLLIVRDQVGSLTVKLNVFADNGEAKGDAFIVAAVKNLLPIADSFEVECKFGSMENAPSKQHWRCNYFSKFLGDGIARQPIITSNGQCVAMKWPSDYHGDDQAAMACSWEYVFLRVGTPEHAPTPFLVAPVSYSLIAPMPLYR